MCVWVGDPPHGPIWTELGPFPAVFVRSFLGGAGVANVEGFCTLRFVVGADLGAKNNPIRHLVLEMCVWVGDPHHGPIRTELGPFPAIFIRSFLGGAGDDAVEGSLTLRFVVGADPSAKNNPIRHLVLEMCVWVGDPTMAPSGQNSGSSWPFSSILFWVGLVAMM